MSEFDPLLPIAIDESGRSNALVQTDVTGRL